MIIAIIVAGFVGWVVGLFTTRRVFHRLVTLQDERLTALQAQISIYQFREHERIAHETHQLALH